MARRILGLDLGSHSVKAVELRQTLRGLEVMQARSLALDDPSPALASELRDFAQIYDLRGDLVATAVASDRASTRRIHFPFRDRRKISPALPFELESQVPFPLADHVFDWEITGTGETGADVAVTLAPRAEVALLLETLREAQLEPRIVDAEGPVLGNLASALGLLGTRLLVDVGHRKTTLCFCVDAQPIAVRSVPVAGAAFTRAIAAERGVGELEAERIKIEEGIFAGGGRPGSAGAVAAAERLAREIVLTLTGLEETLAAPGMAPLQQLDLLGGSAGLRQLEGFLQERVGLPARRLAAPGGSIGAALAAAGDPALFAPAAALAVRASAQASHRLNLRQDDLAHRVDLRRLARELRVTGWLAAAAALLALASAGTAAWVASRRADTAERRAAAIFAEAFPGQPAPADPLPAMQEAVHRAERRADTLGVYRGNLSALDLLTEISRLVPADLDVVFEELSIDRGVVQIKGHSASFGSVDRLRQELAAFEPFSQITVGDITSDSRRGGQNFSVRILLGADEEAG